MLNNSQVKEIFEREAVLIGTSDGVPYYKDVELFGQEAADFAKGLCRAGNGANMYGIGEDYAIDYFTFRGIQTAATYKNISEIRDSGAKGAFGK